MSQSSTRKRIPCDEPQTSISGNWGGQSTSERRISSAPCEFQSLFVLMVRIPCSKIVLRFYGKRRIDFLTFWLNHNEHWMNVGSVLGLNGCGSKSTLQVDYRRAMKMLESETSYASRWPGEQEELEHLVCDQVESSTEIRVICHICGHLFLCVFNPPPHQGGC